MTDRPIFSEDRPRIDWSEARLSTAEFGVKGGTSLALPRQWTPPFALLSVRLVDQAKATKQLSSLLSARALTRLRKLSDGGNLIIRSSIVGESIWERGTYLSVSVSSEKEGFADRLDAAVSRVIASAEERDLGIVIQRQIEASSRGEFGNLQRISKTRDQWEISTVDRLGSVSHQRLNSQRDQAADAQSPILVRSGISSERLFGSIAAWLNNELLRGKSQRLNCEWVTDNRQFYIVQIDEEDEDVWGVNPFQLRVQPFSRPAAQDGAYLKLAQGAALGEWDKLSVLQELWEGDAPYKPTLFYVALSDLPPVGDSVALSRLEQDFRDLIGKAGIIVRTSVAAGAGKIVNLPRTECLTPVSAVKWCMDQAAALGAEHDLTKLAFVAHRFVASRASAWARADPANPMVEIHSLWGLPDALQYCPYDIWEVHVPADVATDYPDYKSDMLVARADGGWEHSRVKNEAARSNSITTAEARDVAKRSFAIAERLNQPCHIMWFIGCIDADGTSFNLPWYWTEAHDAERNVDRTSYNTVIVSDDASLQRFAEAVTAEGVRHRLALSLRPTDLNLMRDNAFLNRVGEVANAANVPIILSGSTLAHAYYQLRKIGCAVVTPTEKEHSRIRNTASLGKLVRDKIPGKIAKRQELEVTRQIPVSLKKGFLISKLVEEALEVRNASSADQKREELADVFEVFRAMAKAEGLSLTEIEQEADRKLAKAGGFEDGLVLLQTGITTDGKTPADVTRSISHVLAEKTSPDTVELPFSLFGFMELDQARSVLFEQLGVRLDVSLRSDRLEMRIVRSSEQLGLPIDEPLSSED